MIGKKQRRYLLIICVLIIILYFLGISPQMSFTEATDFASQRAVKFQTSDTTVNQEKKSHYQLVVKTVSWSEAQSYAEEYAPEKNSHLAVITSDEEWQTIVQMLQDKFGTQNAYVWFGASSDEEGNFQWIDGEPFDYAPWSSGEPSYWDQDGTREACLCAWNIHGQWEWNDQRDELPTVVSNPDGKIAMVIEYYE